MKKVLITLTIVVFICFISCKKKKECEEPPFITNSSLTISFIDKVTGKYLYSEVAPSYNIDSLKVLNNAGVELVLLKSLQTIPNSFSTFHRIDFGPLFDQNLDQESFNNQICRKFFIKYKHNETDTLNVCFKSTNLVCGSVFSTLKVYYKNQLILDKTNVDGSELNLLK